MDYKKIIRLFEGKNPHLTIALFLLILVVGSSFVRWMMIRVDKQMRNEMLGSALLVAQAVDASKMEILSFEPTDRPLQAFQTISQQLRELSRSLSISWIPAYEYISIYSMKKRGDTIYFGPESIPQDDNRASPPGTVYEEPPQELKDVFATHRPVTTGPFTDEYGSFVSAFVPLLDATDRHLVAVIGMDIMAADWGWAVFEKAVIPIGLMLVLCIGVAAVFFSLRRVGVSPKPVMRRLLWPLISIMLLLTIGAGALLWRQHQQTIVKDVEELGFEVARDLRLSIEQQAAGLAGIAQSIAANTEMQTALRAGDVESLRDSWRIVFKILYRENKITHFNFITTDRRILLRLQKPNLRGDRVERATILQAAQTGKAASGIELGVVGTFTLRVVQPVFVGDALVGYIELGKDVESILQGLRDRAGIELAVTIRKDLLDRPRWEEGMRMLERTPDWDRLSVSVLNYVSQGQLPEAFTSWANYVDVEKVHRERGREIAYGGKKWQVFAVPLQDVSGKEVGHLLVMRDVSIEKAELARLLTLVATAGVVLLVLLTSFIYVLLRRTDMGIRAQQAELQTSEENYRRLIENSHDIIYTLTLDGVFTFVSPSWTTQLGHLVTDVMGRSFQAFVHPDDIQTCLTFMRVGIEKKQRQKGVEYRVQHVDGSWRWHATSAVALWDQAGVLVGFEGIARDITERKRVEQERFESEEKFLKAFQASPVLMAISTLAEGRFIEVNERFLSHLGFTREEVIGRTSRELGIFQDYRQREYMRDQILAQGTVKDLEMNIRTREGGTLFCLLSADTIMLQDHPCLLTIVSDITARKRAEGEIQRIKVAVDATGDAIGMATAEGHHFYQNKSFDRLFGYTRDEVFRMHASVLYANAADAQVVFAAIMAGNTWYGEVQMRAKDGRCFPVLLRADAVKDEKGAVIGLIGVHTDITERKQAEEALSSSMSLLNAALESTADGILVVDVSGRVINKYNQKFVDMWHIPQGLLVDKLDASILNFVVSQVSQPEIFLAKILELYAHPDQVSMDIITLLDGRIFERYSQPQKIGTDIVGRVWSFRDITVQQRAEAQLRETNRSLQEATARANAASVAKSQFLANMSHEIRTPMNAILGYGTLLETTMLNEKQQEYVRMIRSGGELLLGVIDDILHVSKFEAGKITIEKVEFNLGYLCHDIFKLLLPKIHDAHINTYVRFEKDVPLAVKGDPTRLRQLLSNLLGNAVKFTSEGEIGISVFKEDTVIAGGFVTLRFHVTDTGIGIPGNKKDAIFAAFTQADESITRKFGGTGLGLTICKTIVEALGGKIWVESREGKGSEFIFTMPFELSDQSMTAGINPIAVKALKGKRVIIVDDHSQNRDILQQYCQDAGMIVMHAFATAKDTVEGIKKCLESGCLPDVIISDIMMPQMSGDDLARYLRGLEGLSGIKLIAITSDVRIGTAQNSHDSGFNGYLPKPISREELLKVIATVLGDTRNEGPIVTRHVAEELQCKGVRILVAEDNVANQMLMREFLDMLGAISDFVNNGQEVLCKLKENQYDLCLMDIQMPLMDGLTATKCIRDQISKDFPIIALSAAVLQEDKEKGMAVGMNDYLNKPVDLQNLKKMIVKWKG